MADTPSDTIAAIATPGGRGGVVIVRISGPAVQGVAARLIRHIPPPRMATLTPIVDAEGQLLDNGLALFFPSPHSFTGEDVLELHAHGGPVLLDMILQQAIGVGGVRLARPGEFTERAFLNGKMDLLQAEAVADLIESASADAVRGAAKSLHGEFSRQVEALRLKTVQLRVYVEGAIDFPDEEIDFLSEGNVAKRLQDLVTDLLAILANARQGVLLRDGMRVVIVGQPNVGKSSLINRLAGEELAIVSELPGTTRDIIQQQILIHGMPVHVVDTAGIRRSRDAIEREGIKRAQDQMQLADRLLLVVNAAEGITQEDQALLQRVPVDLPVTVIFNKIDLAGLAPSVGQEKVYLSARDGRGIDGLRQHLAHCMGLYSGANGGVFSARQRHLNALQRMEAVLCKAAQQFDRDSAGELLADDLQQAQRILNEITGEYTSDDLLGEIFSQFCIGK